MFNLYSTKYLQTPILQMTVVHGFTTIIIVLLTIAQSFVISQQDMCPKVCSCNGETLEVRCNQPFNALGLPHILNPMTKRIIVNNAQTTHVTSSDLVNYLQLELLDLAYNKLTSIDFDHIKSNINLISLNISHNNIYELKDSAITSVIEKSSSNGSSFDDEEAFKTFRKNKINVIELTLSHNQLTTIKDYTFVRWHKLTHVDLSHNMIVSLETHSLVGLTRLEQIDLKSNRLTSIPSPSLLGTTRSLTSSVLSEILQSPIRNLDLSNNPLQSIIANSFISLGKMQELYLEHASIRHVDQEAFRGLDNLYLLSLISNTLTKVPSESFQPLSSLRVLKIGSNQISTLHEDDFKNLPNLEELHISACTLNKIEQGAFDGLGNLKRLDISLNTNLERIEPGTFDALDKLNYLSLYSSSITTISNSTAITKLPLTIVDLRNNHLFCDCDLKWLTKWLNSLNETLQNINHGGLEISKFHPDIQSMLLDTALTVELLNLTCSGPPALHGRLVSELPDNKLECLAPISDLNVHIGFLSLFIMTLVMTTVCTINFCRNDERIIGILKENLMQSRLAMALPTYHTQGIARYAEEPKAETQFSCADYETVNYTHWPIYNLNGEQFGDAASSQNN